MNYDMTGTVKVLGEAQTFSSGFTKREIVVTVEAGKYPQDVSLEFVQDNVQKLDAVRIGDVVTIGFNIRGREYNGRYFNNLVGWKLTAEQSTQSAGQAQGESFGDTVQRVVDDVTGATVADEDLPF